MVREGVGQLRSYRKSTDLLGTLNDVSGLNKLTREDLQARRRSNGGGKTIGLLRSEVSKSSAVKSNEFLTSEFDGVGLVARWVDDLEADLGADGAADKLRASVGSFAGGGLVVDFLNEETGGEAGIEGGRVGENFGDLEHFGVFVDVEGSADTGYLEDHLSEVVFGQWQALEDGPADG